MVNTPSFFKGMAFFSSAFVVLFPIITVSKTFSKNNVVGKLGAGHSYVIAIELKYLVLSIIIALIYALGANKVYAASNTKLRSGWQIDWRLAALLSIVYVISIVIYIAIVDGEIQLQPLSLLIQASILFLLSLVSTSIFVPMPKRENPDKFWT